MFILVKVNVVEGTCNYRSRYSDLVLRAFVRCRSDDVITIQVSLMQNLFITPHVWYIIHKPLPHKHGDTEVCSNCMFYVNLYTMLRELKMQNSCYPTIFH